MRPNLHHLIPCGLGRALSLSLGLGLGLVAGVPAQTGPKPLPADVEALAARVDKAHRPDGNTEPVTRFRAVLSLILVAAAAEQGGEVALDVRYMRYVRPDERIRHLIRYQVQRAGRPIERGRDQNGFWHLFQGKARDLTEADVEDRKACARDTNLARQLVRFLDPGAIIRSLTDVTPVTPADFRQGRMPAIPCDTVEGSLAGFPLLQTAGANRPVRIKMYVNKKDGTLVAVLVQPVIQGNANPAEAELIRFKNSQLMSGMLVPMTLEHSFRDKEGRMRVESRVHVTKLDLRPEFVLSDLDRPK